jgi:hypothetical protein
MKKKALRVNILKDLGLGRMNRVYKKKIFITIFKDLKSGKGMLEQFNKTGLLVAYSLRSKVLLEKINTWLRSKDKYIDIVDKTIYVEFLDDEIEISGNWDNENYGHSNFSVFADLSGNLINFDIDESTH